MALSKADLLGTGHYKVQEVNVPDLGTVCVRPMSGRDRDLLMRELAGVENAYTVPDFSARVAVAVLCDVDGVRMFGPNDKDKVAALPAPVLDAIVKAGLRISGMNANAVEDAEGNSAGRQSDGSY